MDSKDVVAIARRVYRDNSCPSICALFPMITEDLQVLSFKREGCINVKYYLQKSYGLVSYDLLCSVLCQLSCHMQKILCTSYSLLLLLRITSQPGNKYLLLINSYQAWISWWRKSTLERLWCVRTVVTDLSEAFSFITNESFYTSNFRGSNEVEEAYDPRRTLNPYLQHYNSIVAKKALNGGMFTFFPSRLKWIFVL